MRPLDNNTLQALQSGFVGKLIQLVEFAYDSGTLYFTTATVDIDFNGNTYEPLGALTAENKTKENIQIDPATFQVTLSAVKQDVLATFLNEDYLNRQCKAYFAIVSEQDKTDENQFNDVSELSDWDFVRTIGNISDGLLNIVDDAGEPSGGYMQRRASEGLVQFSGASFPYLSVRWRPNNSSGAPTSTLRWRSTISSDYLSPRAQLFGPGADDQTATTAGPDLLGFYITEFNFNDYTNWRDETITAIRFDWDQGSNDLDYDVDYIEAYQKTDFVIVGEPIEIFDGFMDSVKIREATNPQIEIAVRDKLSDWDRDTTLRYNNADQLSLHPDDFSLEFVAQYSDKTIEWPAGETTNTPSGTVTGGKTGIEQQDLK